MSVLGLTGCPGAGKTVVAEIFRELGAKMESGDAIGREVVESNMEVRHALASEFGQKIFDEKGILNRRMLGKMVFSSKENLAKLNKIVHPSLLVELRKRIDNHIESNPGQVLIVDAALIFEWGISEWFDSVITVYADYWLRLKRLNSNGLTENEAADRTDSQIDQDEKIKKSKYTIENNGFIKDLKPKVEKLYKILI
ncbi:MAG: dephospho-CoA kinase [candidate division Zixibacteria bacterium]|nr:dephospho-CoA kinase [candidate division Zixibacteria bacterium]